MTEWIDNQTFALLVRQFGRAPYVAVAIPNAVDLSDLEFERTLTFRDVRFGGGIDVSGSRFASLIFDNCEFGGPVQASHCKVHGSLELRNCRFTVNGESDTREPAIDLDGIDVRGDLVISADGALSMRGAEVHGRMDFHLPATADAAADRAVDFIELERVTVTGSIEISPDALDTSSEFSRRSQGAEGEVRKLVVSKALKVSGSKCHELRLEQFACDLLDLSGTEITGACRISDAAVQGQRGYDNGAFRLIRLHASELYLSQVETVNLNFDGAKIPGYSFFQKVSVQYWATAFGASFGYILRLVDFTCQELNLSTAKIASQFDFQSGEVRGVLSFNGSHIGSWLTGTMGAVRLGAVYAVDSRFDSYVTLSGLDIGAAGVEGANDWFSETVYGTVTFDHCHFGSFFSFWRMRPANADSHGAETFAFGWSPENAARIWSDLTISGCKVDSDLVLTRIQVGTSGAARDGAINLARTTVKGAIHFASPVSTFDRDDISPERAQAAREAHAKSDADTLKAHARRLSLEDVEAQDVDLTGLSLLDEGEDPTSGCIRAQGIKVSGRLQVHVCDEASDMEDHAVIPGALRLDEARIGELRLSDSSFQPRDRGEPDASAAAHGIVLERAEIGRLHVPRNTKRSARDGNGFPVPLDLSGVTVRHWTFERSADGDPSTSAKDYLDFLDNDERFHREVYRSVAAALRETGNDDEVERILFAEEFRARKRAWVRRPGNWRRPWRWTDWRPGDGRLRKRGRFGLGLLDRSLLLSWRALSPGSLERVFTRYRRKAWGLLYPILALFVASALFVAPDPRNFELSDTARTAELVRCGRPGIPGDIEYRVEQGATIPDPDSWDPVKWLWLTARYHVPLLGLAVQDDFVPSDDRLEATYPGKASNSLDAAARAAMPTSLCAVQAAAPPESEARHAHFSARDWFGIMEVLNWIMWPLLLTFLLRRALRDD